MKASLSFSSRLATGKLYLGLVPIRLVLQLKRGGKGTGGKLTRRIAFYTPIRMSFCSCQLATPLSYHKAVGVR